MKKLLIIPALFILFAMPVLSHAQGGITPVTPPEDPSLIGNTITRVINFAFGLLLFIAAAFIVYAAFLYLTAKEDNIKTARSYLIYAVVAIVVGFLARALVALVRNVIGA